MWSNNTGEARIEGDQIEVFNILNGHESIDPNIFFFQIKTGKITRGHALMLVKGQSRVDFRKYSFSQRPVNENLVKSHYSEV